jgi:four helix bundle protein
MSTFDLEERTLNFSKNLIRFCNLLPKNQINFKLVDQLIRSGTSVGANYREANETDTKNDFRNRIRISKKEAKETMYWLDLVLEQNKDFEKDIIELQNESGQFVKILAAIFEKTK